MTQQNIEVRTIGAAEYHIPVRKAVASEAGKEAIGATVTIDTGLGVYETYDARGELIDISEPE